MNSKKKIREFVLLEKSTPRKKNKIQDIYFEFSAHIQRHVMVRQNKTKSRKEIQMTEH